MLLGSILLYFYQIYKYIQYTYNPYHYYHHCALNFKLYITSNRKKNLLKTPSLSEKVLKCLDFYNRYIEIQFNVVGCCFFFYTFSVILNQDLSDIYCGLFLSSRLFFYFLTKIITREEGHHFYYNKINCYGCLFFIIIFVFYMYLYLVYTIQMWCQPNCIFYSFLVSWENYVIQYNVPKEWQQIPAFSMWIEKCWRCSTFFSSSQPKIFIYKKDSALIFCFM